MLYVFKLRGYSCCGNSKAAQRCKYLCFISLYKIHITHGVLHAIVLLYHVNMGKPGREDQRPKI